MWVMLECLRIRFSCPAAPPDTKDGRVLNLRVIYANGRLLFVMWGKKGGMQICHWSYENFTTCHDPANIVMCSMNNIISAFGIICSRFIYAGMCALCQHSFI